MTADQIRQEVIRIAIKNHAGHIAPSLSCVDILYVLYYEIMNENDYFILSKAHGGYGLYAILAQKGLIPKDKWENFELPGCVERIPKYGIEAGCGSLGHGLPMAVGLAWALKLQNRPGRIFCLVGDGECQEGTTWESLMFACHHKLDNLHIIIDRNGLQAMEFCKDVINMNLTSRFAAFGTEPVECYGHNHEYLKITLNRRTEAQPIVSICNTIKGYGLQCAENVPKFHFRVPTEDELSQTNT